MLALVPAARVRVQGRDCIANAHIYFIFKKDFSD